MHTDYRNLISSARVSPQTRAVMLQRMQPDDPAYAPSVLTSDGLETLRSVLARVIPQETYPAIDLAARLDEQLASGKGDGWRYAALPSDADACRIGILLINHFAHTLSGKPFTELSPTQQDGLLDAIASGRLSSAKLDLKRWFEDLVAGATQIYVSHPTTLARMGYSGIADDPSGFVQIGLGQVESWEPSPKPNLESDPR